MADISKCSNTTCPSREECFRYRVKPSEYMQSYAPFSPKEGEDKCEMFGSIEGWNEFLFIPKGALVKDLYKGE